MYAILDKSYFFNEVNLSTPSSDEWDKFDPYTSYFLITGERPVPHCVIYYIYIYRKICSIKNNRKYTNISCKKEKERYNTEK